MSQFARTDSVASNPGAWTDLGANTLWDKIDEIAFNDQDYVQSVNGPVNALVVFTLTNLTDPLVSTGHIVRYRIGKNGLVGMKIDVTVALYQGATLIASWPHLDVQAVALFTQTLSTAQADAITDYSDLELQVTANKAGGGSTRAAKITWFEFEVPDAGSLIVQAFSQAIETDAASALTRLGNIRVPITPALVVNTTPGPFVMGESAMAGGDALMGGWVGTKTKSFARASEIDTAAALSRPSAIFPFTQAAEVEAVPGVYGKAKTRPLPRVDGVETAQPFTRVKTKAFSTASESDSGTTPPARKTKALAQASEADSAALVASAKTKALPRIDEADSAAVLARVRSQILVPAVETDTANPLGRVRSRILAQVVEADQAKPYVGNLSAPLVGVVEVETAQAFTPRKAKVFAQAAEVDLATATLVNAKTKALGQAVETDLASTITATGTRTLLRASETDMASTLVGRKTKAFGQALEADTPATLARVRSRVTVQAVEADAAQVIARRKTKTFSQASETDQALAYGAPAAIPLPRVGEADQAGVLVRRKALPLVPGVEAEVAQVFGRRKTRLLVPAVEIDAALEFATPIFANDLDGPLVSTVGSGKGTSSLSRAERSSLVGAGAMTSNLE